MRTLAIGDIHGCYHALKTLESFAGIRPEDHVITLGDHIHRGPDTRSVVQWLIDRRNSGGRLTALKGNHECVFQAAVHSEVDRETWLTLGGKQMLTSYEVTSIKLIPEEHRVFLHTGLDDYYENETHFFVHANACEDLSLKSQPDQYLFWKKFTEPRPHHSGKVMICGHTPQRRGYPRDLGHAICIDTSAARKGWLTCLEPDKRYVWQANEAGETRSFSLDATDRIAS